MGDWEERVEGCGGSIWCWYSVFLMKVNSWEIDMYFYFKFMIINSCEDKVFDIDFFLIRN